VSRGEVLRPVVGDGYVIVDYQPALPVDQLAELRAFVTDPASGRVVGGPAAAHAQPVKAVHAYRTELLCTTFDLDAFRNFRRPGSAHRHGGAQATRN
jgi:hypothetical protein